MRINPSGSIFYVQEEDKMLVLAFQGNRLDSVGGCCKARDFKRRLN